jgi:uncharacterized metal-binding protein
MNQAGTDLNVVLGLCVGHDSLFIKHSQAPATYLVVKDHVLDLTPCRRFANLAANFLTLTKRRCSANDGGFHAT